MPITLDRFPIPSLQNGVYRYIDLVHICFRNLVKQTELDAVLGKIKKLETYPGEVMHYEVRLLSCRFETPEVERNSVDALDKLIVMRLQLFKVTLGGDPWRAFFESCVEKRCLTHVSVRSIDSSSGLFRTLVDVLPRLSLASLAFSQVRLESTYAQIVENAGDALEELDMSSCYLTGGDVLSTIASRAGRNLRRVLLCFNKLASVGGLPHLLYRCKKLESISIMGVPNLDLDKASMLEEIKVHPCFMHVVGVFDENFMREMDSSAKEPDRKNRRVILAFMTRCIKRVSTRSSVRKLFCDVDRLVWSFLM